jgi:hypothetical protein
LINKLKKMRKLNIFKAGYIGGVLSVVFLFLCVGWVFLLKSPELQKLHLQLLQMTYPGFNFTFSGLAIAFGEAFLYGLFFGVLFSWLFNRLKVMEE